DGQTCTAYFDADGLVHNDVNDIALDEMGHKWFATGGGVNVFNDRTWQTYTTADGLASHIVNTIAIDQTGHKWFGTNNGVSELISAP
ncbi:two component regulator propeller domain-containing protein, partial [Chloroflexota bacterium]